MGVQGPLTAQALGRSPYDEVVEGDGEDDHRQPRQQYDHRGRPVNPETKRMNKDIVRAHNEVMLVIGVAETDNPNSQMDAREAQQIRQNEYEKDIAAKLFFGSKFALGLVGVFGVDALRQRILVYQRFSEIPFWQLYKNAYRDGSLSTHIWTGAPAAICLLVSDALPVLVQVYSRVLPRLTGPRCVDEARAYIKFHWELFIALQRLGLVANDRWVPPLSYFIPFSAESPISAPPLPSDMSPSTLLQWLGGFVALNTPFLLWFAARRLRLALSKILGSQILRRLPHPGFPMRPILPAPAVPTHNVADHSSTVRSDPAEASSHPQADAAGSAAPAQREPSLPSAPTPPEVPTVNFEDYASDEEDNGALSGTLISFDIENSEASSASQGLYSAELRPSAAPGPRPGEVRVPQYHFTPLTQYPAMLAADNLTYAVARVLTVPFESLALCCAAQARSLAATAVLNGPIRPLGLTGWNWISTVNFFGSELLHLALTAEVWAAGTLVAQALHLSEEEWKEHEEEEGRLADS